MAAGNNCSFTDCKTKTAKFGLHPNTCKLILLNLGMIIGTSDLDQGHRCAEKQNLLSYYLTKFSIDLEGNWYDAEIS